MTHCWQVKADTPRYQVREVESNPHVPGRSTTYSSLLSPWIYSRGHGRQQTCTEYGNGAHEPREPPNPGAHLSKRGGMPLTCQINILFDRKRPLMLQPSNQHRNEDKFRHRLTLVLYYLIQTDQTRRRRRKQTTLLYKVRR